MGVATKTTRELVVDSIMEHGPSTAKVLAERLDLTSAAIRRHLSALLEEGILAAREQRVYGPRGRGRPSQVFALTDRGRAEFQHAYDDLAISALRRLVDEVGPQAVRDVARERVEEIERRFEELRMSDPHLSPEEALTEALSADGYAASLDPVRSGHQICQHHCPVAHVATEFPTLCEVETELFSRLLDSHVQRLATIAHGDGVCTTHVPHPVKEN